MKQKALVLFVSLALGMNACKNNIGEENVKDLTICNPLDLSYRFCPDEPSRREAADPTIVLFRDVYYLFASKSGGYWHSSDLAEWKFIETNEIPVEEYAPCAIGIGDTLYFLASSNTKSTIYKSGDPMSGKWEVAVEEIEQPVWDPAFFMDDDNKLYLYWGCSDQRPIYGAEVDFESSFAFKTDPVELIHSKPSVYGWEVPGDYNRRTAVSPWIEGAWMNKHNGIYYLQYAGPGTEFKSYADGVYTSGSPLGPFRLAGNNPFASRPEGYIAGAGHGSTFMDKYGNYWHIGTGTISQKHMFERRLVLHPVFFDNEGNLHADSRFGDYPVNIPQRKISSAKEIYTGWMLLSYGKKIEVSSSVDSLPPSNISDEDIRTYWAAKTGDPGESVSMDLGEEYDVYAVQVNFAEHGTEIYGRQKGIFHRYIIEYSKDNQSWNILADKSENNNDNSHPYIELPNSIKCRYIRLVNREVPGGNFALSGFRVFGKGDGEKPVAPEILNAERKDADRRQVKLSWDRVENAMAYNILFGTDNDELYRTIQVYEDTIVEINSLNSDLPYFFRIEAFNENGISDPGKIIESK